MMISPKDWKSIKPCPFCGEDNQLEIRINGNHFEVACIVCNCTGPIAKKKEVAVAFWNVRGGKV
jgi:Lar family restriction alleviation protein